MYFVYTLYVSLWQNLEKMTNKKIITFRASNGNSALLNDLKILATIERRSLNSYLECLFLDKVRNSQTVLKYYKEQNGLT